MRKGTAGRVFGDLSVVIRRLPLHLGYARRAREYVTGSVSFQNSRKRFLDCGHISPVYFPHLDQWSGATKHERKVQHGSPFLRYFNRKVNRFSKSNGKMDRQVSEWVHGSLLDAQHQIQLARDSRALRRFKKTNAKSFKLKGDGHEAMLVVELCSYRGGNKATVMAVVTTQPTSVEPSVSRTIDVQKVIDEVRKELEKVVKG